MVNTILSLILNKTLGNRWSLMKEGCRLACLHHSNSQNDSLAYSVIFNSFSPTYRYRIENGKPVHREVLNEELWKSSGVVYARVNEMEREAVYIGKTDNRLSVRIADHLRRIPQYSRKKDIDFREWAEGKTVTIYAYKPKKVRRLGISISTHAGLESALIDSIKPMFVARK